MNHPKDTQHPCAAPWVASIPLAPDRSRYAHVIVHSGRAAVPAEGLRLLLGFHADGRGGFISAAQAGDGRFGYLDGEGRWRVPPTLENARSYSPDGLARFQQGGLWGFVDLAGQEVVAPRFADARPFRGGLGAVKVGDKAWRVIDRAGHFMGEETFHDLSAFGANGLARAVPAGTKRLQGFVDREGRWVVEPGLAAAHPFGELAVTPASIDGDTWGLIDARGHWVLKPRHAQIDAFNSEGLAFFQGGDMGDRGYLDAKGRVVVQGAHYLSDRMVHGMVVDSYNGSEFRRANGQLLPTPPLDCGSAFQEKSGVAVVRACERQGDGVRPAAWGLLHTDGRVFTVGEALLEPMTDSQGWLDGEDPHAPLLQFLARDGSVAWVDREGTAVWRARYDGRHATLFDAEGNPLWRSDALDDCQAPTPFFHPPSTAYLEGLATPEDIGTLARMLLDEAEAQVHRLAAGEALGREPVSEDYGSDYWDEDDDAEDEGAVQADRTVVVRRVARAYLDEEHCSPYDFLGSEHGKAVRGLQDAMAQALAARYGAPDSDPEHAAPLKRSSTRIQAWAVPLAQPLPGDRGVLRESREQWLTLYYHSDTGDGDRWSELWLVAAPSLDALETARRARDARELADSGPGKEAEDGEGTAEDDDADPVTYEGWLQAVEDDLYDLEHVPAQWVDGPLVDAALVHEAKALAWVPAHLQTPERLEALVRRGVDVATAIPPQCMTEQGLALARELHAGDSSWKWLDKRNSRIPSPWGDDSLEQVWGFLLTPAHALKAVRAKAPLYQLPHRLRSDEVEAAAVKADLRNIRYIDKAKITPALAALAVRHKGSLIEVVPSEYITPQLCLEAARSEGESLRWIPEPLRSVEVCMAALDDDAGMLPHVPEPLLMEVATRLIDDDLAGARKEGEPREHSHWYGTRAWLKLWDKDYEGALADARLGRPDMYYEQHAHYVMACALRALGREQEAAQEASNVLALESPYTAEWDDGEDTHWLHTLARSHFATAGEDALVEELRAHPQKLADIPRERITHAMVDAALEADEETVKLVPRRLMTPARYAAAVRQNTKPFGQIPPGMLGEEACIAHVARYGGFLAEVPENLRTLTVCAHAVRQTDTAMAHVPEALRSQVPRAIKRLPPLDDEDA